jgi:hypothetical protein
MFFVIPAAIGIMSTVTQMSTQKTTGLHAVAGGPTYAIATFGLVAMVGSEAAAIVLLLRTLSRNHPIRTIVAIVSICCSGLLLLGLGLFFWSPPVHQ